MSTQVAKPFRLGLARKTLYQASKLLVSAAILAMAAVFVTRYALHYYFQYNQAAVDRGITHYWEMRGWLLMHVTAGMVALLSGPWQFWTGFRARYALLHRWTGYVFLCGVGIGSVAAVRLAIGTTFGWAFGFVLLSNAAAWTLTTVWLCIVSIVK